MGQTISLMTACPCPHQLKEWVELVCASRSDNFTLTLTLTINNPIITTQFLPLAHDHSVIQKQSLVAEWSWARISSAHWIDWGWYDWWSSSTADALRPCWRIAFEGRIDPQQLLLCWGCCLAVSAGPTPHLGRVWFGVGHMPLKHTPDTYPKTYPWNISLKHNPWDKHAEEEWWFWETFI